MRDDTSDVVPTAPDAVRVWRGFRNPNITEAEFFEKLGSHFIPGTVQIQRRLGLTAYMPSVLPSDKPDVAPDEIALVFYKPQKAYEDAKLTVAGRAYSDLHATAFDLTRSKSGFPKPFAGDLEPHERYHLFTKDIDWQKGVVNAFVGVTSGNRRFHTQVAAWLSSVQSGRRPDGAISSASEDFVAYWEHWPDEASARASRIAELADLVDPVYQQTIKPYVLETGLWERWKGLDIKGGESFNFQFDRTSSVPNQSA